MPRWARFLSCTLTGLLISMTGFIVAAYLWEGSADFWSRLADFMATPAFRYVVLLFTLLTGVALLLARIVLNLSGAPNGLAGLLCGALTAAAYAAFLIASHATDWGGVTAGLQKAWPAAAVFAVPFALAGAFTTWLWDRLD